MAAARLQRRAYDPTQYIEPGADVLKRLANRLTRLEASIEAAFAQTGKDQLSAEDGTNLYRLLEGFRGLSEATVSYAGVAGRIDWALWKEEVFS